MDQASTERREAHLNQIHDDARQLADDIAVLFGEEKSHTRERLQQFKRSARHYGEQAGHFVREKSREADEFAHERPWTSIAIAAAVGAVLGALLPMSRRRWRQ